MIGYPLTMQMEIGVDLKQVRAYHAKASTSHDPQDLDNAQAYLERFLFMTAFLVRKFLDAGHLREPLATCNIPVVRFPPRTPGVAIDPDCGEKLPRWFAGISEDPDAATAAGEQANLSLRTVCNQIIHSATLLDCTAQDKPFHLLGFVVVPDRAKHEGAYYIKYEDFFPVIEQVIVNRMDGYKYNRATGFTEKVQATGGVVGSTQAPAPPKSPDGGVRPA